LWVLFGGVLKERRYLIHGRGCTNSITATNFGLRNDKMKSILNLRVFGNNHSLGLWSIPFVRCSHRSWEEMRLGKTYSSMTIPVQIHNTPDVETLSLSNSSAILKATISTSTSNLTELANTIKRETETLDHYVKDNNLPEPSFDVDAPLTFTEVPDELKKA
jgi:hypothetical protein